MTTRAGDQEVITQRERSGTSSWFLRQTEATVDFVGKLKDADGNDQPAMMLREAQDPNLPLVQVLWENHSVQPGMKLKFDKLVRIVNGTEERKFKIQPANTVQTTSK